MTIGWLREVLIAAIITWRIPVTTPQPQNGQLVAARIELLALRAAIPESTTLRSNAFRVSPGTKILGSDDATLVLAHLPKPAVCSVAAEDGVVQLRCVGLDELDRDATNELAGVRRFKERPLLPSKGLESDQSTALVLCIGRGQELLVSLADAREWYRAYYNPPPRDDPAWGGYNMRGDYLDNPFLKDSATYIAARNRGAMAMLEFMPPIVRKPGDPGGFIMAVQAEGIDLSEFDSARSSSDSSVERNLLLFAKEFAKVMEVPQDSAARAPLVQAAAMMRAVWAGREMPTEVASFVARFPASLR
jgi:hypothetical protein